MYHNLKYWSLNDIARSFQQGLGTASVVQ